LAGTNVESEDEEEDSMIMIQDFFHGGWCDANEWLQWYFLGLLVP
jgi:hypothetical protein